LHPKPEEPNFLNLPIWGNPADATLCCKKCIRSQHAGKVIRRLIGSNFRRWATERISRLAAVLQITRAKQRKFNNQRDEKFDAPLRTLFAFKEILWTKW
jgi:hypothetical protein